MKNMNTIKLDQMNYFVYKAQILTYLRGINLLSFIEKKVDENDPFLVQ